MNARSTPRSTPIPGITEHPTEHQPNNALTSEEHPTERDGAPGKVKTEQRGCLYKEHPCSDTRPPAVSDLIEAALDDLAIRIDPTTRRRLKAHLTDLMTAHHLVLLNRHELERNHT